MSQLLLEQCQDLKKKRPGSVHTTPTRVLWVKMLTRPMSDNPVLSRVWKCRSKFNQELENILKIEQFMRIVSVRHMEEHKFFNILGDLTQQGQHHYWNNINSLICHFDFQRNVFDPIEATLPQNRHRIEGNTMSHRSSHRSSGPSPPSHRRIHFH